VKLPRISIAKLMGIVGVIALNTYDNLLKMAG
jgi:hypothetical protein